MGYAGRLYTELDRRDCSGLRGGDRYSSGGVSLGHELINRWCQSRSPTHKLYPDSAGGEFDEREVVGIVLFEARGDCSEMLELVEEAFDEVAVAVAVEPRAEGRDVYPIGHRFDVSPGSSLGHRRSEGVAVIGPVGEQDVVGADAVQHVGGAAAVVGLAFGQLERDGVAVGVNHGVYLGGQSAARAPHASGCSNVPRGGCRGTRFLSLVAC